MTIQSILVQQKFEIGEIWFSIDSGFPDAVIIESKPYMSNMGTGYQIKLKDPVYGLTMSPFLGDFGVYGHRYDDRPCKLYRTLQEAEQGVKDLNRWLDDIDRHF